MRPERCSSVRAPLRAVGRARSRSHGSASEKKRCSRPVSRILSASARGPSAASFGGMTIPLVPALLTGSSNLPGNRRRAACSRACARGVSLFGLAPCGVLPATTVTSRAVRSYRTISPLPAFAGGIFSVPLSVGSPRPGITRRTALWSSDFPLPRALRPPKANGYARQRSSGQLQLTIIARVVGAPSARGLALARWPLRGGPGYARRGARSCVIDLAPPHAP